MDVLHSNVDIALIIVGAFLGAAKASIEIDGAKTWLYRGLDILLGVFVGVTVAYHYGSQFSVWLMGLVALIGGVSGALVVDVFLQVLPTITKQLIIKKVKKFFE